jgi:hypothetical protein
MKQKVYVVPALEPRVFVVSTTGIRRVYDSYQDFLKNVDYSVLRDLGTSFASQRGFQGGWENNWNPQWVAMLEGDSILNPDEVYRDRAKIQTQRQMRKPSGFRSEHRKRYKFRDGPVPCIGRYHGNRGSTYIHPRTTQERRWSLAAAEDGIKWRGRRNFHSLPNVWDDKTRYIQKNWKEFRKQQWKPRKDE